MENDEERTGGVHASDPSIMCKGLSSVTFINHHSLLEVINEQVFRRVLTNGCSLPQIPSLLCAVVATTVVLRHAK